MSAENKTDTIDVGTLIERIRSNPQKLQSGRDIAYLLDEIKALRAENERLRLPHDNCARMEAGLRAENERLRAEVEYLKKLLSSESVTMNNWQVRYREWVAAGMPDEGLAN